MTSPNRNFMLQQKPLELAAIQETSSRGRNIKLVNAYLHIPAFTAPHSAWSGASYIVARIPVRLTKNFAIRLPITRISNTFCATIKWNEGTIVRRYKLWTGVGEKLGYAKYSGQVVPDSCTAIEIWSVTGRTSAVLPADWDLFITELNIPYNASQLQGTEYDITTICFSHPYAGDGLDGYFNQCSCGHDY